MGKYFTVEVKPTMPASVQHAEAYANTEILFDWTSFEVPKGPSRLVGITALVRGIDGADQAGTIDMELFYAKTRDNGATAPPTLGTTGAAVSSSGWQNHMLGRTRIDASGHSEQGDLVYMNVMSAGHGNALTAATQAGLVLQGEPDSGSSVGYDTLYIAGISKGALDFSTTVLARGGEAAGVRVVETDKGSDNDPDAELIFAPGDVLHSATNDVLGTVKSIAAFGSSKQDITFTAPTTDIIADNEEIYNINPITLILQFEK